MGSAPSNKGRPATPRDGAPIELVALQYSVISFMADLSDQGLVQPAEGFDYREWAETIKFYFEDCFFVPDGPSNEVDYQIDWNLVNRKGIYKDSYKSTHGFTDY